MEFVFLDESGDVGARGSKFLIVALMCVNSKKKIVKIIRDAKRRLLEKNKSARWLNKKGGEIKSIGFPDDALLRRILNDISKEDVHIHYLAFEKEGVAINLNDKKMLLSDLFNHVHNLNNHILPEKIVADSNYIHPHQTKCFIVERIGLDDSVVVPIPEGEVGSVQQNFQRSIFCIEHKNSKEYEELQAVDLICGAIFKKYEFSEESYFDIIKNIIRSGKHLTRNIKNMSQNPT